MHHFSQSWTLFGINSVPESGLQLKLKNLKIIKFKYKNIKLKKKNMSGACPIGEVDFWIFLDFQFPTVCN
jgi:hypothetical protein